MIDLRHALARQLARSRGPVVVLYPAPPLAVDQILAGQIGDVWSDATAALSRWMFSDAGGGAGGQVAVPQEASDPAAARVYLVDAFTRLSAAHGWPGDQVVLRLQAMSAIPTQPTVTGTVRALRAQGPDLAWPSAVEWYDLADGITGTAAMLEQAKLAKQAAVPSAPSPASTPPRPAPPRPAPAPAPTTTMTAPASSSSASWAPPEDGGGWTYGRVGLAAAGGLLVLGGLAWLGRSK